MLVDFVCVALKYRVNPDIKLFSFYFTDLVFAAFSYMRPVDQQSPKTVHTLGKIH